MWAYLSGRFFPYDTYLDVVPGTYRYMVMTVQLSLKVILCASEHICLIVRYCLRSFKQL